jgi:signal transduction histidine kinase
MVNQLFELAKIESPSFAPKREPFVFSEMMGEVLRQPDWRPRQGGAAGPAGGLDRIEQRGMEDGAWIEADVAMMERVLQNLVVNALAYTPAGGRIVVALEREGASLVFRIENEGKALPEDLLEWINEAGASRPAVPAIGLTIVRRMLSLHGYGFCAESRDGRNCFQVRMQVHTFDTVL